MRRILSFVLLALTAACTDAGVYALQGSGVPGPDRTAFEGDVCVPLATGDTFPVKVGHHLDAAAAQTDAAPRSGAGGDIPSRGSGSSGAVDCQHAG